jgi:predicted O-linked N-acetylglucosamine transferase (SPINDLY family)
MGVPVITLAGQLAVHRSGVSLLQNLALPELIAATPEKYVQAGVALANDLSRLANLRATLRERIAQSALMDAAAFARDLQHAYRSMWQTWCHAD